VVLTEEFYAPHGWVMLWCASMRFLQAPSCMHARASRTLLHSMCGSPAFLHCPLIESQYCSSPQVSSSPAFADLATTCVPPLTNPPIAV
jgi:hypothetical protein